jgi:competence protein ComEA
MGPRVEAGLTLALTLVSLAAAAYVSVERLGARPPAVLHETPDVTVSVRGEVTAPGTYRLPWGSRVADLLAAAGGPTSDADTALVALAAPLTDGRTVVVPSARSPEGDGRVDLNTASERLLTTLPGVGPVTARRIIEARPFHRVEDLLRVPGIGPARLEQLRLRVTL